MARGNAVVGPNGELVDILRVQTKSFEEKAAIVRLNPDGSVASFDPASGFVNFPGGAKKFTIRYDPQSKLYWSLATAAIDRDVKTGPDSVRNTLALTSSPDLRHWTIRCVLLHDPDIWLHGFQYVDWLFDGDDLIAVSRTAYDDAGGGAHSFHDANFLTFHRFKNFRSLTTADSVQTGRAVHYETPDFVLTGYGFDLGKLANGARTNLNRDYVWAEVPQVLNNWQFTRVAGGETAHIVLKARRNTTIGIATALSQPGIDLTGWQQEKFAFQYSDKGKTVMTVFSRAVKAGEEVVIPQGNWSGGLVLMPPAAP